MRDQPGCGRQDRGRRAIIGLQADDTRAFKILLEAEDVFHFRAAPGVNRLVVIADAADVAMTLGEQAQP